MTVFSSFLREASRWTETWGKGNEYSAGRSPQCPQGRETETRTHSFPKQWCSRFWLAVPTTQGGIYRKDTPKSGGGQEAQQRVGEGVDRIRAYRCCQTAMSSCWVLSGARTWQRGQTELAEEQSCSGEVDPQRKWQKQASSNLGSER